MQCASIQRDASSIAWCPISEIPSLNLNSSDTKCNPLYLLASVHQDMDASFNSSSQIEILNTSPSIKSKNKNNPIYPLGCSTSKQNFTTLAWGQQTSPSESMPLGIIAGGMEDGCITFWNPYDLINHKNSRSLIGSHIDYHQQKITAMQFNPSVAQHTFLATCDVGEKLYVWDLTNISKPIAQQPPTGKRHNNTSTTMSSYPKYSTALAWNNNVSYILAVSNCVGQTQIYDLRNKKVALTFESKNIDKAQSISWNPCKARQLAVCYVKGEAEIWDLKQPKSPKMYLRDHTQHNEQHSHGSILDLSWNNIDSNLLLTSHEYDNDVCLGNIWNGNNGKLIHQISFNKDPKLKIEWNNNRGGVLATMSTEKISLYNVNYFGVKYCPKWLNKKCGVKLGFGGKVVSFGNQYVISASTSSSNLKSESVGGAKTKRKLKMPPEINVGFLPKSQAMIARAKQFKATLNSLATPDDLRSFTESKLKSLRSLKLQVVDTQKNKANAESDKDILSELGISESESDNEEEEKKQPDIGGNINKSEIEFEIKIWEMIQLFFHEENCKDDIIKYLGFEKKELIKKQQIIQQKTSTTTQPLTVDTHNESESDHNPFGEDSDTDAEDFFNTLSSKKPTTITSKKATEEFKIIHKPDEKKAENIERRFEIPCNTNDNVRNAIITGNYRLAIELSLAAGNIADALVFAYYGKDDGKNKDLWDVVKKSYFKQHSQQFIASTFSYIAERDYYKLVVNSDLQKWRETLAILLTFTAGDEFKELCNLLGQRIVENVPDLQGAIACFLCSHNIASLISIWNIPDPKKATDLVLNACITKALIYVNTPYVQKSLSAQKRTYNVSEAALSGIFCKYANLLANQGSLEIAQMFLEFVDKKLKKPHGRNSNDPQIKQLMMRINTSQKSGIMQMQAQKQKQSQKFDVRRGPKRPIRQQQHQRRTPHEAPSGHNIPPQQVTQPPKRIKRGPRGSRGPPPRSRGGKQQQQHSQTQQRPQRQQRQPMPQTQSQPQPQSQSQPSQSSGSGMPMRRGRGRGRPGGGRRTSGANVNPSQQPSQPQSQRRSTPTHSQPQQQQNMPPRGGMNGTTAMPHRNRSRQNIPPQQQNIPQQQGMQNMPPRGRQNMPPTQRQNNMPPPQQQPHTQQQPQQNNMSNMPPRAGRRSRGRGKPRGGRPPQPTMSPQQVAQPQQQRQQVEQIEERPLGYSAAKTSSGTGFFGQSSLLEDDGSQQKLPENAADTLASVKGYLNGIILDENVINTLSVTQAKTIKTQSNKLLKDLNDLIVNHKMSYYAYSSLLEIFNSLQSRQYDNAMKQTTVFIKSCQANKQEKFTTHRKWVMAFQSIIRIAKQYNI